ncbi:MAG: hypothetical protein HRT47_02295 [Candidatus Caenarcaniphilales bacterium]|nr:hypothetical protein [Candidatus Caenarcaniphilales bacterium]
MKKKLLNLFLASSMALSGTVLMNPASAAGGSFFHSLDSLEKELLMVQKTTEETQNGVVLELI